MFANIPAELRGLRQWVLWRLEWKRGDARHELKPTKIPYGISGRHASVTDAATWASFDDAISRAPFKCLEPCEPDAPITQTGASGIGFVFQKSDGYCGIDLDNVHGDPEAFARQMKIFNSFASYSEFSPSGQGLHIICKANLPGKGRRRSSIEIYDNERYFTMTGNIHLAVPIAERQELAELLYSKLGGPVEQYIYGADQVETQTDEQILETARDAGNGDKFSAIYDGQWQDYFGPQFGHPGIGQSEADFALIDILAFYTQNRNQIARIFYSSQLGARYKTGNTKHNARKIGYMVEKSFDRQLPPIDVDGLNIAFEKLLAERALQAMGGGGKPSGKPPPPVNALPFQQNSAADPKVLKRSPVNSTCEFPPGLVGEVAQFIYDAAPRPVREIALAGAIGFIAGLTGRAYNIGGSGLNQYIILIADTGRGKEAIASGLAKLITAVQRSSPTIVDYEGPAQIASSQALSKWLARQPCIFSIVGEFGLKLRQMADERAPPHLAMLKADLLALYHKAGHGDTWGAMAYAKREENTAVVKSPSFTLIGESTPLRFFENISEDVVTDGLLPRFTIFTYEGDQVPLNPKREFIEPSLDLVQKIGSLVAQCSSITALQNVQKVELTYDAKMIMDNFEAFTRHSINNRDPLTGLKLPTKSDGVVTELWNRAHVKASRLAAVCAVGVNYLAPCVTAAQAAWATNEIYWQTRALLDRFKRGDVGGGAINAVANEDKQTEVMCHCILGLATGKGSVGQYRVSDQMQSDRVFPFNLLLTKLRIYPAFKNDRRGASNAIRLIYQQLLDNDDLREVPKDQMQKKYGRNCRAFAISNSERFLEEG